MDKRKAKITKDVIARRRTAVARMRLAGMTIYEIADALEAQKLVNPETQAAWAARTIARDLEAMNKAWLEQQQEDFATRQAIVNAKIQEAQRIAYLQGDMSVYDRLIGREIQLWGLAAPARADLTVRQLTHEEQQRMVLEMMRQDGLDGDEAFNELWAGFQESLQMVEAVRAKIPPKLH